MSDREAEVGPCTLLLNARRCPWCWGSKLWVWDRGVPGWFAISCSNPECAATGPLSRISVEDAVARWNRAERPPGNAT